ncbi:hypothetical protein HCN44_001066 [Aphidius gifuensis]|uniref:B-block binding subunit of TFIIIC domain-containing protein n=1 Tax=Aphidius gifuensis TaxID=684658 RepID=A0A834XLI2_APHGI|nr:general transcription factor 3C polypeptide 1-like [Aphidius gifuensis]KAF7988493.1 hypothetical protein HCN44_001066 [Aphidius gifuensis]
MEIAMDNMIYSASMNLVDIVVDEIALEGMDGITLEALWTRLSIRLDSPLPMSEYFMEQVWEVCISIKDLKFYELPKARTKLVLFNRYNYVDEDLGTIIEPDDVPDDIYKHCPIDDIQNNVRGSCMDYNTRRLLNNNIKNRTLKKTINKYGNKLVIVASQSLRENALMGDFVCPTIDLTIKQYCFLERIGRSRYHGEVTQGKRSLVVLGEDPKTLFYHRKVLTKHKLITKQMHHQKNSFHGTPGSLLHLVRFYVERKPKMIYLAEKIVDLLKTNNSYTIDLQIIKKNIQMDDALRKLMKMTFFKKIVCTINVPYRKLYPNAIEKEWKRKSSDKEKYLYALQLINPNYQVNDLWYNDDTCDDDDYFELDISSQCINRPLLTQANEIVESKIYDGMSQTDLSKIMGLTRLGSRSMFRNLEKIGIVGMYIDDVGRQRTSKYVSRKYEKNSNLSKTYLAEKNKLLEHKRISMSFNNSHSTTPTVDINNQQFCSVFIKTDIDENLNDDINNDDHDINADDDNVNDNNNIEIIEPIKNLNNITFIKRSKLFSHVNKVFKKYKLNRHYKITFKNLAEKFINDKSNDYSMMDELVLRKNLSNHCSVVIKEGILKRYSQGKCNEKLKIPSLSTKKITRKNMISDTLEKYKIIDIIKMMNIIDDKEKYCGTKIDKKSIYRLLEEMEDEKLLKNINITLTSLDKQKIQNKLLICHLSININEALFQLAIEDAQLKFTHPIVCRNTKRRIAYKKNKGSLKVKSTKEINKSTKQFDNDDDDDNYHVSPIELVRDNRAGYKYGIKPKFGRMKMLHLFLYYRIYDNKNINKKILTRKQQINELCQHRNIIIDDKLDKEMSKIYNTDADWKMFIPPLSLEKNSPIGWISMSEIVYFMPLSLCLNIYNPCHIIPDLDDYINHPIRKHYLIKDLSVSLKKTLFDNKYMSSVYESIKLLCYIGLIQFGPHHYKRKDEIEIYVNQKSELINTIDTSPNYYRIDKDKKYPIEKFIFNTMQDVDEYWNRMHYICINTPLGSKIADEGKEIEFEKLIYKPDMIKSIQPVGYNQAKNNDSGILPGDKLGAAGIDSAFFSHRKRNWDCINANNDNQLYQRDMMYHDTYYNIRNTRLSKIRAKPVKFVDLTRQKSGPTNLNASDLNNETTPSSSSSSSSSSLTSKDTNINNNNNNNNNNNKVDKYDEQIIDNIINNNSAIKKKSYSYIRKILPRKKKQRKRVKYDDIDKIALQNMNKLRVDWSPHEDSILLMCKVVMMYLCPNPRSQLITFTAVRDVLRLYSSTISQNKTSRACQRRLLYMLKDPHTLQSVALRVEEIKQNFFITDKYGDIVDKICKLSDHTERDDKCAEVFKELVAYVVKKYYNISRKDVNNDMYKINTIQEFNLIYDLIDSQKLQYLRNKQYDINNIHDIHLSTINSVLYSSMNNSTLTPCDYQFEKIYKQYPEYLLRIAIGKIRSHQMISLKKSYKAVTRKRGNFMPLSSRQYQFSINYNYKFQTKLPYDIYHEIYDFFIKIFNYYNDNNYDNNGIKINSSTNGGMIIGIYEFLKFNNINFNVDIPDHIIALDPNCGERDETFTRISTRYQDILTTLEQLHFERNSVNIKQERQCDDNSNEDIDDDLDDDMNMDMDINTEESDFNDEADKQKRKSRSGSNYKTFTWTFPYVKALLFDENHDDNQDNSTKIHEKRYDNYLNDNLIDSDFIRLQDGTVIEITKNDVDKEKLSQFDEDIYDIFINTRDDEDKKKHSYNDRSTIIKLKALDDNDSIHKRNTSKLNKTTQRKSTKSKDHDDYDEYNGSNKYMDHELIDLTDKNKRKDDQYDVKRRYTRLAMLKMREELTGDLPNSHHAHEYFVVNAFDIFYKLTQIENEKINNPRLVIDDNLKKNILMVNDKLYDEIISDLTEYTLFPTDLLDFDAIKKSLIKHFNINSNYVDNIIDYIEGKREFGATLKDITINFYKLFDNKLYKIISFLTKSKLFLRSGVTETRFIHKKYADPWMIKSDIVKPCPEENINIDDQEKKINDDEEVNNCDMNMEIDEDNNSTASNKEPIIQNIQTSDSTTSEKINVIIRPWIKIDGTINHKVYEKMLGAILSHCTMNPGIFMTQVQDRFSPALQYHHTRELIEVLVKLGCLKLTILQKPPSTLFSNWQYSRLKCPLVSDGSSEFDDEIIIDTTVCSTVRFSSFLRENRDKLQS